MRFFVKIAYNLFIHWLLTILAKAGHINYCKFVVYECCYNQLDDSWLLYHLISFGAVERQSSLPQYNTTHFLKHLPGLNPHQHIGNSGTVDAAAAGTGFQLTFYRQSWWLDPKWPSIFHQLCTWCSSTWITAQRSLILLTKRPSSQ